MAPLLSRLLASAAQQDAFLWKDTHEDEHIQRINVHTVIHGLEVLISEAFWAAAPKGDEVL